ncbi:hypothetical protein BJ165DRAFT_250546 [Panaeolus papilionaceus]|nr:hypothetical protein BJ165DRAFT_250546 [Panaeolus papilionaceus]
MMSVFSVRMALVPVSSSSHAGCDHESSLTAIRFSACLVPSDWRSCTINLPLCVQYSLKIPGTKSCSVVFCGWFYVPLSTILLARIFRFTIGWGYGCVRVHQGSDFECVLRHSKHSPRPLADVVPLELQNSSPTLGVSVLESIV